jgi:hypothetical protein
VVLGKVIMVFRRMNALMLMWNNMLGDGFGREELFRIEGIGESERLLGGGGGRVDLDFIFEEFH